MLIGILVLLATLLQPSQVGRPCPGDAKKFRLLCIDTKEERTTQRKAAEHKHER